MVLLFESLLPKAAPVTAVPTSSIGVFFFSSGRSTHLVRTPLVSYAVVVHNHRLTYHSLVALPVEEPVTIVGTL